MLKSLLIKLLYFFSQKILAKYQPKIIGITGSVGKTSTKEAVAVALGGKFRLRQSPKSYNNEIGIPLTIIGAVRSPGRSLVGWAGVFVKVIGLLLRHQAYPEVLVLEMGADKPGDISYLTRLAPGDSLQFDGEGAHGPTALVALPIRFLSVIAFPDTTP